MKQSQLPTEPEHEILSNPKSKTKTQSQQWPQVGGSAALTTRVAEVMTVDVQDDDFFGEDS